MTVYAVIAYWWDTWEFLGVFQTREAADAVGAAYCAGTEWGHEIHETELAQ